MEKKKKNSNETSSQVWQKKSKYDWNLHLKKACIKRRNEEIYFERVENTTCNGSSCMSDNECWFHGDGQVLEV